MEKIKEKILEAQGFNHQELEFYQKFFNNFDCRFRQIYGKKPIGGYLKDSLTLELNVNLNSKAKTIDDVASQLEEKGIELGKLEKKDDGTFNVDNEDGKYETRFYEKATIKGSSFEQEGEFLNYSYDFFPQGMEINSKIVISNKD